MISFQIRLMGATSLLLLKNHAELFQAGLVEVSVAINPLTMIIYPNIIPSSNQEIPNS